jgi:hypothetical protein
LSELRAYLATNPPPAPGPEAERAVPPAYGSTNGTWSFRPCNYWNNLDLLLDFPRDREFVPFWATTGAPAQGELSPSTRGNQVRRITLGAAIAALVSQPLSAQQVAAPAQTAEAEAPAALEAGLLTLNAGMPLTLAVAQEVNSSTHRAGDTFPLTVLNDVRIGETVVIPRGTPAVGEVTWRTGKGAFGKSGKLEFSLRYINLNGQHIPVTGDYRQEGEGNTIATGVAIIAVGVFAGFVTGHRARLPMGRELMSQIARPVQFTADGQLASSYDAGAAMAAAEANSPVGQCRAQARALAQREQERALRNCFRERME